MEELFRFRKFLQEVTPDELSTYKDIASLPATQAAALSKEEWEKLLETYFKSHKNEFISDMEAYAKKYIPDFIEKVHNGDFDGEFEGEGDQLMGGKEEWYSWWPVFQSQYLRNTGDQYLFDEFTWTDSSKSYSKYIDPIIDLYTEVYDISGKDFSGVAQDVELFWIWDQWWSPIYNKWRNEFEKWGRKNDF